MQQSPYNVLYAITSIFSIIDIIKLNASNTWYITDEGCV